MQACQRIQDVMVANPKVTMKKRAYRGRKVTQVSENYVFLSCLRVKDGVLAPWLEPITERVLGLEAKARSQSFLIERVNKFD